LGGVVTGNLTDGSLFSGNLAFRGRATVRRANRSGDENMNIWKRKSLIPALAATLVFVGAAAAADGASKDDAVAMVKKAVATIKGEGPDKAYPEFTNKDAKFIDRDLYVVVYQLDGKVLAHGSNPKFVGKDMSDAQDVDGKFYVKERVELAGKQPSFWQDYKFVNPVDKKVEPKQMYCEKLENTAVCAGIYKN
jgi:cytochrome c